MCLDPHCQFLLRGLRQCLPRCLPDLPSVLSRIFSGNVDSGSPDIGDYVESQTQTLALDSEGASPAQLCRCSLSGDCDCPSLYFETARRREPTSWRPCLLLLLIREIRHQSDPSRRRLGPRYATNLRCPARAFVYSLAFPYPFPSTSHLRPTR